MSKRKLRINGHSHLLPYPEDIPQFMKDKGIFWVDKDRKFMLQKDWSRPVTDSSFFLDEKSIFSIITFILICGLLFIRHFFGISGKKVFNIVFLSYFFINFSYFGIKIFW